MFNDRGACIARAQVTSGIRPLVIAIPTGAWFDPNSDGDDTQGNPNVLTRDIGTSRLGQGSSAHSTLVDVEPLDRQRTSA
ncbi:MAG: molybdopterin dinucleotide binding domain-containing protein [Pseudomonadota bacterium]